MHNNNEEVEDRVEVVNESQVILSRKFYSRYDGHDCQYLKLIHSTIGTDKGCIFLAGDSSLDNKYWFYEWADAMNGFEVVLSPPIMKQDVSYWINLECTQRKLSLYCLNTAVEASSLNSRSWGTLLDQDRLIKETMSHDDYLIVSVGGNDIALAPQLCTVANLLVLSWCTPACCVEKYSSACVPNLCRSCPNLDLGCCGCGVQGCLFGFPLGCPPAIGYFVDLFKNRVENYVRRILPKSRSRYPKKVLVCMIYFLDELATGGWADCALKCMCYDSAPIRLQTAIRSIFKLATQQIKIAGTQVVPVPLFEELDGKTSCDYLQRVEPSPAGGKKMAKQLMNALQWESSSLGDESERTHLAALNSPVASVMEHE